MLIIFGSTGNVAKALLSSLRTDHKIATPFRIITRDENCSVETLGFLVGTEIVRGNITDSKDDLVRYLSGGHKVFCVLPQYLSSSDMVEVSKTFAEACVEASVTHVVRIGSFGIDGTILQGSLGSAHVTAEAHMHSLGLIVTSIRPTSFFSNFTAYDLPSLRATGSFASPLGHGPTARVNWISCDDIGSVAAMAMQNDEWDGRVLEITGSVENTLSVEEMRMMLSSVTGKNIVYTELPLPDATISPDMHQLWMFLRQGGFGSHNNVVRNVLGREPLALKSFVEKRW